MAGVQLALSILILIGVVVARELLPGIIEILFSSFKKDYFKYKLCENRIRSNFPEKGSLINFSKNYNYNEHFKSIIVLIF
jgi:hypothetical protein